MISLRNKDSQKSGRPRRPHWESAKKTLLDKAIIHSRSAPTAIEDVRFCQDNGPEMVRCHFSGLQVIEDCRFVPKDCGDLRRTMAVCGVDGFR